MKHLTVRPLLTISRCYKLLLSGISRVTEQELDEIAKRCSQATAGPWRSWIEGRDHTSGSSFISTPGNDIELSGASAADQDFIAAARQDVPALIAEVARLRSVLSGRSGS